MVSKYMLVNNFVLHVEKIIVSSKFQKLIDFYTQVDIRHPCPVLHGL